ncbi:MAG: hypothetical protein ACRETC_01335, partial [Gammaproteobacteria bacterium]
ALSADGTTALVGADDRNSDTGAAYVFTESGGVWSQQTELTDPGLGGDVFGVSVALASVGTEALVGADGHDNGVGAAYVFTESGSAWSQQAELAASDGAADDFFGTSVALSADGATALAGAYGRNSFTGAAYVFTGSGAPPTVTGLGDIIVGEGEGDLESFSLTGSTPITHTVASSNATVLPPAALTVIPADCGADNSHLSCQLSFIAAAVPGTAGVTLMVTGHSGQHTSSRFTVTVAAPPTLTSLAAVAVTAPASGRATVTLTGTGILSLMATSSNTKLLPDAKITGESSCNAAGSCRLTLTPVAGQTGSTTVTMQVSDNYDQSDSGSFTFTVNPPAAPAMSGLNNLTVTTPANGTESFTLAGTGTLTMTVTSSNTTLLPNASITGESSCTAAGSCTLTLTPVAGQTGKATITIHTSDAYGQSGSGSFTFTVKAASSGGGGMVSPLSLVLLAFLGLVILIRRRLHLHPS